MNISNVTITQRKIPLTITFSQKVCKQIVYFPLKALFTQSKSRAKINPLQEHTDVIYICTLTHTQLAAGNTSVANLPALGLQNQDVNIIKFQSFYIVKFASDKCNFLHKYLIK
ncbi:hypothetical protein KIL84_015093 [Mauremys mutica]|uniref:Uncharacterized protein n=1 Tax=Mauremys mutica TaxID=74926 RepID=A0A9D3XQZ5_9SAUR|nr:hypothetical protein KIL84_015093 [Mauremys mutica]